MGGSTYRECKIERRNHVASICSLCHRLDLNLACRAFRSANKVLCRQNK